MKLWQPCVPAFALLLAAAAAHASPITYSFTGDTSVSGAPTTITGQFTLDTASQSVGAFAFAVNGSFAFDNSTTGAGASAGLDDGGNEYALFGLNLGGGSTEEWLLDFSTLPGPLDLNAFQLSGTSYTSGIYVFAATGGTGEYVFTSGSASVVTPEPPTLVLFAGGLLLLGLPWRRRFA